MGHVCGRRDQLPRVALTARSAAYLARLKAKGGQIVAVRMTAAQLAALDALRIAEISESRSACVNRLIDDRAFAVATLRHAYGGTKDTVAPR